MRPGAAAAAVLVAAASVALVLADPPAPTPALLGVLVLALLCGALYASAAAPRHRSPTRQETHSVRRKSSSYKYEATREPFELELDARDDDGQPRVVVFTDPNSLETEGAFDLAMQENPKRSLQTMLDNADGSDSGQWALFWPEWRTKPVGALNELLSDVMEHYGADQGKLRRSSR